MRLSFIMIIDDDPDFVDATKNLLESKGFTVNTAANSEEGLKAISKNVPDLLLLDVMMTKRDEGFEFSRKLSKDEKLLKKQI